MTKVPSVKLLMFCKSLLTHHTNRLAGAAESTTENFPKPSEECIGHRSNLTPTTVNGRTHTREYGSMTALGREW